MTVRSDSLKSANSKTDSKSKPIHKKNTLNLNCEPMKVMLETTLSFKNLVQDIKNSGLNTPRFRYSEKSKLLITLPDPVILFSPRPVSELDSAAVKLQKVHKSYRTRRNLADCVVVVEELWWKALDFGALKKEARCHFLMETNTKLLFRDGLDPGQELPMWEKDYPKTKRHKSYPFSIGSKLLTHVIVMSTIYICITTSGSQKYAIADDYSSFHAASKEPNPEPIVNNNNTSTKSKNNDTTVTTNNKRDKGENEKMHVFEFAKCLSYKWSTGTGPKIGCVHDYPTKVQFHALEQVNLSPRIALGSFGNYG